MAITGKSQGAAVQNFCDTLNRLFNTTITQQRLTTVNVGSHFVVSFRRPGAGRFGTPTAVPLQGTGGSYGLAVAQHCDSIVSGSAHILRTLSYRYALYLPTSEPDKEEPVFRWEYEKFRQENVGLWCRHHLQGTVPIDLGQGIRLMNEYHLPTGYVTIEEVIRFLIVDLGVTPLAEDWDKVLEASYRAFKEEYTN